MHLSPKITQSAAPSVTLTIAGSDSGAGAGIQADIKAISATGSYAVSVLTVITAQNTRRVLEQFPLPLAALKAQFQALTEDFDIAAIKTGMLGQVDRVDTVATLLEPLRTLPIIVDPVMVSTTGCRLLDAGATASLVDRLFPLAELVTPNLAEAAALLRVPEPKSYTDMCALVGKLQKWPCQAVLLKGGHLAGVEARDLLIRGKEVTLITGPMIKSPNTHGTGCTLSAAIASFRAQGQSLEQAVYSAKNYVTETLRAAQSYRLGKGRGPLNHFPEKRF